MRRGDVWRYRGLARDRLVLVVSDDELNKLGDPIVVDVTESGPTGSMALLTVRLNELGYARSRRITFAEADRFVDRVEAIPADLMDQVDASLRVALAL